MELPLLLEHLSVELLKVVVVLGVELAAAEEVVVLIRKEVPPPVRCLE